MAPRAYWSGYLRLSLVSLPVRLYSATTTTDQIQLHHVDRKSAARVHYQPMVDERPVDKNDVAKGYEFEKDRYVVLDDDDLKRLKLETSKTIDLSEFVDAADLDPLYLDKPYYLAPDGPIAEDAFRVIREALRTTRKVGIGQITLGGKERIAAVALRDRGMVLTTLRSQDEVRAADAYFEDIHDSKVDAEQLKLAESLITSKAGKFDPAQFQDHYQAALKELVQAKLAGVKLPEAKRPTAHVINLMDALRKSVAQAGGAKSAGRAKPGASSRGPRKGARGPSRKRASAA
jgi:DNA end-binding protein Ku